MSIKTLQIPQNLPPPQPRYRGLTLPKLRFREGEVGGDQREVSKISVFWMTRVKIYGLYGIACSELLRCWFPARKFHKLEI
jgi:hypothetical protein